MFKTASEHFFWKIFHTKFKNEPGMLSQGKFSFNKNLPDIWYPKRFVNVVFEIIEKASPC